MFPTGVPATTAHSPDDFTGRVAGAVAEGTFLPGDGASGRTRAIAGRLAPRQHDDTGKKGGNENRFFHGLIPRQ
jgi:hypothetical protein